MKKIFKNPLTYVLLIFVLIASFYGYKGLTGRVVQSGQYDEFAQCLTGKEIVMYGTDWCSFCQRQKDLFGVSFKEINFVDCDRNRQECLSAGVQGYPTWKINGENYPGLQSLEQLSFLTNCALE